jgi:hypothetical protein
MSGLRNTQQSYFDKRGNLFNPHLGYATPTSAPDGPRRVGRSRCLEELYRRRAAGEPFARSRRELAH